MRPQQRFVRILIWRPKFCIENFVAFEYGKTLYVNKLGKILCEKNRIALKLEPKVDHWFDGVPKEVVYHSQDRQDLISN